MNFDPIYYVVDQLSNWWDFLWSFHPFPDSVIFDFPMAALLIGFSCISIILDYFNGDDDNHSDDK